MAIAAGQSGLWIETQAPHDLVAQLVRFFQDFWRQRAAAARTKGHKGLVTDSISLRLWDCASGETITQIGPETADYEQQPTGNPLMEARKGAGPTEVSLPRVAAGWSEWLQSSAREDFLSLLVLTNPQLVWNATLTQQLVHSILQARSFGGYVVVLSPITAIPIELQRLFYIIEHDLPTADELSNVLDGIVSGTSIVNPQGEDRLRLLDMAVGLTKFEECHAECLTRVSFFKSLPVQEIPEC